MCFYTSWKIKRLTKKLKSMRDYRLHNQPQDAVLKKEMAHYIAMARLYKKCIGKKRYPHAEISMLECYRNAALLGNLDALYLAGQYLVDEANFRNRLIQEGLFTNPENEQYRDFAYEQAHKYLEEADKYGHIEAKRLRGLCLIHGWGLPADTEKGFDLIVTSIDLEQSWDKVPELFEKMGLNKPEFFSRVMQRRGK